MAGRKGEKFWADAIRRAVNRRVEGEGDPKRLDVLANKLVDLAEQGEIPALKEIGDRLDGRPKQETESKVNVDGQLELTKKIAR